MSAEPETTQPAVATPEGAAAAAAVGKPKKEKKAPAPAPVPSYVPVPVANVDAADFGDLPLICSAFKTDRVWTEIKDISAAKNEQQVLVRARISTIRAKGKTCFIQLRSGLCSAQAAMFAFGNPGEPSVDLVKYAGKIPAESLVEIYGTVRKVDQPIESCTQKDAEIHVSKIFVISASVPILPFQMADANRFDPADNGQENDESEDTAQEVKNESGQVCVVL